MRFISHLHHSYQLCMIVVVRIPLFSPRGGDAKKRSALLSKRMMRNLKVKSAVMTIISGRRYCGYLALLLLLTHNIFHASLSCIHLHIWRILFPAVSFPPFPGMVWTAGTKNKWMREIWGKGNDSGGSICQDAAGKISGSFGECITRPEENWEEKMLIDAECTENKQNEWIADLQAKQIKGGGRDEMWILSFFSPWLPALWFMLIAEWFVV